MSPSIDSIYLLNAYYVSSTVLGTGDTMVTLPCLHGVCRSGGEGTSEMNTGIGIEQVQGALGAQDR